MRNHLTNLFIAMLVIVSAISVITLGLDRVDSSVTFGNDYKSTEITSSVASTSPIIVKSGTGSLGSIVIASTTLGASLQIYDNAVGTSSATSTRIATFPAGTPAGTYTFDREIQRGIVVYALPAFNGSYVVTYR
jgi:hypothetical protein